MFYRCPLPKASYTKPRSPNLSRPETDFGPEPDMMCPCGVGLCLVRTSRTEKNPGRRFYKCPQETGCGFFLWCDEKASCGGGSRSTTAAGPMRTGTKRASWDSGGGPVGASQMDARPQEPWVEVGQDEVNASSAGSLATGRQIARGQCRTAPSVGACMQALHEAEGQACLQGGMDAATEEEVAWPIVANLRLKAEHYVLSEIQDRSTSGMLLMNTPLLLLLQ
eukprot:SM000120S25697  [mRNA]  locus=s120:175566:177974:- [translate_table: standard]